MAICFLYGLEADGITAEEQKHRLYRSFCSKMRDFRWSGYYIDSFRGDKFKERLYARTMLNRMRSGDVIMVCSMDRITSKWSEIFRLMEFLNGRRLGIVSIRERLDLRNRHDMTEFVQYMRMFRRITKPAQKLEKLKYPLGSKPFNGRIAVSDRELRRVILLHDSTLLVGQQRALAKFKEWDVKIRGKHPTIKTIRRAHAAVNCYKRMRRDLRERYLILDELPEIYRKIARSSAWKDALFPTGNPGKRVSLESPRYGS